MTSYRDDTLGPSSSIRGRLRGMFGQKSRVPITPTPPTISMPSRIPTRKKRCFTEVTDDEQDRGSAVNPRAGTRQRLDPSNHLAPKKSISRKSSDESIRTIREREPRLRRTSSTATIVLDPGRSAPARAVLTRSTTHNREISQPTMDQVAIPFPSKKRPSLPNPKADPSRPQTKPSKKPSSPLASVPKASSLKRSRSIVSLSEVLPDSSSPSSDSGREEAGSLAAAMAAEIPRARSDRSQPPEPMSPEDAMLKQVLEYVVHDVDNDDEELDALVSASSSHEVSRNSNLASMMSVDEDGNEYPAFALPPPIKTPSLQSMRLSARSRLDRFDAKVQPCKKHTAIWDLGPSDVYSWPALLCITDKELKHTGFESRFPIQNIEIDFHSVGDTHVASPSHTNSRDDEQATSAFEFATRYNGTYTPHRVGTPTLVEADGICLTNAWHMGPYHTSVVASEKFGTESPVDGSYLLKFYVPIPVRLFEGREYRKFKVKAKVVFGAWDLDPVVAHSGTVQVTIEHLRKEVHMDGTKPLSASARR